MAIARFNYAKALVRLGRYGDAALLLGEVRAIEADLFGEEHPDVLNGDLNLAIALASCRQFDEVGLVVDRCLAGMRSATPPWCIS
ncbi:tetratricopeptide repeat protein [Catenulispora rubra]|uniref:tetratricopeptide repeat protein n=1 Tax=Catenulispora rubra TaxID=280293 RepID=UPI001892802D|nr:tetratricopeptide repeat protein [Catenulispora rubra]